MRERRIAARKWRRRLQLAVAAAALAGSGGHAAGAQAPEASPSPSNVFGVSRSLAIEAARTRLGLFVLQNPEVPEGGLPGDAPECPIARPETMTSVATLVAQERAADIALQLEPWLGRTTSNPELRPDSAAQGEVQGIPIVRCDADRPADGAATRPGLFAISLGRGVSFSDVVRLHALEGLLRVRPADIGGEMVGECVSSEDTSVCVVLWHSRSLVIGITLEGPPEAVNTATAGATLAAAVPAMVDTLAVVVQPAPVCSADSILASTGVDLLDEPICHDGWAFGSSVQCPSDLGCDTLDVFHVESAGWVHDGVVDVRCTESLTRLGMTVVTAREIAPEPCDDDDSSLSTGTIRRGRTGTRVVALQIALTNQGYVMPIDGRYGPLTQAAVVDYQVRNALIVDGIVGRQTQGALGI